MEYFEVFEFKLHDALLTELTKVLNRMVPAELSAENVNCVEEGQGVYQLFYQGKLVYVGKTDAEAGLRRRLLRHSAKIRSRLNLDPSQVHFKAVRIYVFAAMDLEAALLKHYKDSNTKLAWNKSGFGSNDPGRKRDNSELKKGHFDLLHPIDLDLEVMLSLTGKVSVASVLAQLKNSLAYTIRFQGENARSKKPHPDLVAATVCLGHDKLSVRRALTLVAGALGSKWQVTMLPGHMIIYKERKTYDHGIRIGAPRKKLKSDSPKD